MLRMFRKKTISEKWDLEGKLSDIKNILYANTNASVSQMRTFVEALCKAILIYEGIECNEQLKLVDLIIDGTIDKAVQGNVTAYRVKKYYKNRY